MTSSFVQPCSGNTTRPGEETLTCSPPTSTVMWSAILAYRCVAHETRRLGRTPVTEPTREPSSQETAGLHRRLAAEAFNETWRLLDADRLTREEEETMLASTFAQRHHWYHAGTERNRAIADWQVSRVAVMRARRFGERSLEVATESGLDAFVRGFAHEAIARAAAEVDDVETFTEHLELAKAALAEVEDDEEREILAADLAEMSER